MGRQIQFYMLPEDRDVFIRTMQQNNPVVIATRDSQSAEVRPADDLAIASGQSLCLWNRDILPHLERSWVPDPGYYRVDSLRMPVLEFTPPFTTTWEGEPAIGQGRLFGDFESYLEKPKDFEKWYEELTHWIRKNYRKSPVTMGGYVGTAAYESYKRGYYLLPNFIPPRTKEWLVEIGKQHVSL